MMRMGTTYRLPVHARSHDNPAAASSPTTIRDRTHRRNGHLDGERGGRAPGDRHRHRPVRQVGYAPAAPARHDECAPRLDGRLPTRPYELLYFLIEFVDFEWRAVPAIRHRINSKMIFVGAAREPPVSAVAAPPVILSGGRRGRSRRIPGRPSTASRSPALTLGRRSPSRAPHGDQQVPGAFGSVAMPCLDASGSFDSGRDGLRSG